MSYGRGLGLVADGSFEDPANARIIQLAALGLFVIAVLLGVGTWWWWKQSKVEHPALGPLEVMGTKRWWKSDFTERRRALEAVRPAHEDDEVAEAPVPLDLDQVLTRDDPHSFDDLLDPTAAEPEPAADAAPAEGEAADVADASGVAVAAVAVAAVDGDATGAVDEPAAEAVADDGDQPADEPAAEPADVIEAADVSEPADASSDLQDAPVATAVAVLDGPAPEAADEAPTVEPEPASQPQPRAPIVIDTAPKPKAAAVAKDAEPAPAATPDVVSDSDPTPAPIDPLLRLRID